MIARSLLIAEYDSRVVLAPGWPTAGLKRLFLYGPAHRAQMLAKAQGGRFLALRKVGAELYLAAQ
jgi:hypothetical protein